MAGRDSKQVPTRAQYDEARRNSANYFKCEVCGKQAHRVLGGSSVKKGYRNRFCSQACRKDYLARERAVRCEIKRQAEIVKAAALAQVQAEALAKQVARRAGFADRPCAMCGTPCGYGTNGRPRRYCSEVCNRKSPPFRESQKSHRAARNARERNLPTERFKVVDVFERDGWRCQICGVSTPRSRRGTRHANAPELDHIVPLSKHGAHTMANTQCSCRACNQWKSDTRVVGQVGLFG